MYEVFLNARRIIMADAREPAYLNKGLRRINTGDMNMLVSEMDKFLAGEDTILTLVGQTDWLWPSFQNIFKQIPAAGGVVSSEKGTLFIYRRKFWDLPKGKIDTGETSEEAALREVREETGLVTLSITGEFPSTWHLYQSPFEKTENQWILKETKWFTMMADGNEPVVPETDEDIEAARWFSKSELPEIVDFVWPSLKNIIPELL
jgi:8-oxo-dGTP pyrophosphatase MutT (NUDIX family)